MSRLVRSASWTAPTAAYDLGHDEIVEDNVKRELAFEKDSGYEGSISSTRRSLSSGSSISTSSAHTSMSSIRSICDATLDFAEPYVPHASASYKPIPVQANPLRKHLANFQCGLCPKKFTRNYNLRSHLRTHTEERPFVCTVCGAAFARLHDRKRHEGLHSGEKKFECRGELHLPQGAIWGCGRRFARIDALGRHFRSEAGQTCLKPLIDKEGFSEDKATTQRFPSSLLARYPDLRNFEVSQDYGERIDSSSEDNHLSEPSTYSTTPDAPGKASVSSGQPDMPMEVPEIVITQSASALREKIETPMIDAEAGIASKLLMTETHSSASSLTPSLWTDEGYYTGEHSRNPSLDPSSGYQSLDLSPACSLSVEAYGLPTGLFNAPMGVYSPMKAPYLNTGDDTSSDYGIGAFSLQMCAPPLFPQMLELQQQQILCKQSTSPGQSRNYVGSWTDSLEPVITQKDSKNAFFPSIDSAGASSGDGDFDMTRLEIKSPSASVLNAELVIDLRDRSPSRSFHDRTRQRSAHDSISSMGELSFVGSIDSDEATELWERELPSCLRTLRSRLVDHLLLMYKETLVEENAEEPLDCGDTSSSSQQTSADTSSSGGATKSSATSLGKRAREDGDIDSNGLQSPGHKKKRVHASLISLDGRLLACPYNKMDPSRYSEVNTGEKNYRGCSSCYLTTISRLKQHLYRVHKRPDHYCACCFKVFESKDRLDAHARSRPACEVQDPQFSEKMTYDQVTLIRRRAVGQDQSETWFAIFDILFPRAPRPLSAYADSVSPEVVQRFVDHFNRQARGRLLELIRIELEGRMLMDSDQQRILDSALESALAQLVSASDPIQDRSGSQSSMASPEPNSSPPQYIDSMDQYPEATIAGTHPPQILLTSPTLERVRLHHETFDVPANHFGPSTLRHDYPLQNDFGHQYSNSHLTMDYANYSLPDLPENGFFNNDL